MPIPQIEKKKEKKSEHARDASSIRRKRATERDGRPPHHNSVKSTHKKHSPEKKKTGSRRERFINLFRRENIARTAWIFALGALGTILIVIGGAYAWVAKDLADIEDIEKRTIDQSTNIYASDGTTLLYEVGDNRRQDVTLDQIRDEVEWATISLEDQQFYTHHGFKITSIIRAALKGALPGGHASATSTLTQQFIKNAVLTSERSYTRKVKELILAIRLEQKYSKDEILNMYLNEVYYGANYQGVEAASQGYFGISANELNLAQAATLAALPQNPVILPRDPERLKGRSDYALDQMVDLGYIGVSDAEAAKQITTKINDGVTEINAPHFVFMVREYLEEEYGQSNVRRGGMKVITTLDWDKQKKAEEAIEGGMSKIEEYGGSNAALVSIDAHTGKIVALVGSRDFFDEEHDGQVNVATSLRQPGSSFKPIVYLTAFTRGLTPNTKVYDVETDFLTEAEGKYHPRNYDLGQRGPTSLRSALAQSLNIPAVKVLYIAGVENALNIAEDLGYTSLRDRSRFGLSLVLGGAEVSLLEHTSTFTTFAREGERHPVSFIERIEDREGNTLEEWHDEPSQVVEQKYVRALNSVLSDSGARGGFAALNIKGRQTAAKTGTTNDYRDAWTMGYTPSLATGVWAGNNDNTEMHRGAAGLVIAAPIWNTYMSKALEGTEAETFNTSDLSSKNEALGGNLDSTVEKMVDTITGEVIPDECINQYPTKYQEKREFKETHTLLYYITKENPTGGAPENPRQDPMYEPWETAVVKWAEDDERKNEYLTDNTPKADCNQRLESQQPVVSFRNIEDGGEYIKSELSIAARVKAGEGRTITSIEFIVDVISVDRQSNISISDPRTVESSYDPSSLTPGKHDVTVRVADDKGNTNEATIKIEVVKK